MSMKKIAIILLILLFSLNSFAQERKLLNCARKIISNYQFTPESIVQLSNVLQDDPKNVETRLEACQEIKKSLEEKIYDNPDSSIIKSANIPENIKSVLLNFAYPNFSCSGVEAGAGFALFGGVDVNVQLLYCIGTNGSQSLLSIPKIAIAYGFGVCATVGGVVKSDYSDEPGVDVCLAAGIAYRMNDSHPMFAVGAGLGAYATANESGYFAPAIKLTRLPSDYKKIIKQLNW